MDLLFYIKENTVSLKKWDGSDNGLEEHLVIKEPCHKCSGTGVDPFPDTYNISVGCTTLSEVACKECNGRRFKKSIIEIKGLETALCRWLISQSSKDRMNQMIIEEILES